MKNNRTLIIFLIIALLIFSFVRGCHYLDLEVSKKYETQLEGITNSESRLRKANDKAIEINESKRRIRIELAIAILLIVVLASMFFKFNNPSNSAPLQSKMGSKRFV